MFRIDEMLEEKKDFINVTQTKEGAHAETMTSDIVCQRVV